MYLRTTKTAGREYLRIFESYRDKNGKPTNRVVRSFGRIDNLPDKIVVSLIKKLRQQIGEEDVATISASDLGSERPLAYGNVFALHALWKDLKFDHVFGRGLRVPKGASRRKIDVEALVRAMVFNRVCAPRSKLGCVDWLKKTAVPNMPKAIHYDDLLRAMDVIEEHSDLIQKDLATQMSSLLDHTVTMTFYDLTTIRIHGEAEVEGDIRADGMNKETGRVARQVMLGLVQTAEGLPIMHEVYPGNTAETKTLQSTLETLFERFPTVERVILVADRGLVSERNVNEMTALAARLGRKLDYIFALPSRRYTEVTNALKGLKMADGEIVETKSKPGKDKTARFEGCRLIVAHDGERAERQTERRKAAIDELQAAGMKMVEKIEGLDDDTTDEELRAADRKAHRDFKQAVAGKKMSNFIEADLLADMFTWDVSEKAMRLAKLHDGKLVLVTSVTDLDAEELVARYKNLADIERAFRVLKSDLKIAPVHHRRPDRIRAHAMICFLALVLFRELEIRLRNKGMKESPRTMISETGDIQKINVRAGNLKAETITPPTEKQLEFFDAADLERPV